MQERGMQKGVVPTHTKCIYVCPCPPVHLPFVRSLLFYTGFGFGNQIQRFYRELSKESSPPVWQKTLLHINCKHYNQIIETSSVMRRNIIFEAIKN